MAMRQFAKQNIHDQRFMSEARWGCVAKAAGKIEKSIDENKGNCICIFYCIEMTIISVQIELLWYSIGINEFIDNCQIK